MVKTILKIKKPLQFNFRLTVNSHGWYSLPPFALDEESWVLRRVFSLENSAPVAAEVYETKNDIEIAVNAEIKEAQAKQVTCDARHILRLDDNFDEFYSLMKTVPELAWISERGAGRLLRSPTVWEDLIKTICTTNCSWSLTKKMVENIVEKLGEPTADGAGKSFPTAEKMAAQSEDFYKNEIRAGYRAPYFVELAQKVANDELDVEAWAQTSVSTAELKKQMKQVKGVGDYAAENLLKLLGRYNGLALDSWLRKQFANKHNVGEACEDAKIRAHYEKFSEWQGLAIWCDMTENWH
jgi:3-methyladenine DNA glycosylase/8-oxoguanine DNA glycosylase